MNEQGDSRSRMLNSLVKLQLHKKWIGIKVYWALWRFLRAPNRIEKYLSILKDLKKIQALKFGNFNAGEDVDCSSKCEGYKSGKDR